MGSAGGGEGWRGGGGGGGEGWPGLFWSQTDMFRFEMSRAGSVTEAEGGRQKVEGGGDKAGDRRTSGPETSSDRPTYDYNNGVEVIYAAATK